MSTLDMPDFFDKTYFSEDCTCDRDDRSCDFHQNEAPKHSEDIVTSIQQVEINQSFPRRPLHEDLIPMIEYRIKLLSNNDIILKPGQIQEVQTNVIIKRKCGNLSMLVLGSEDKSIRFYSEGYVNPNMRGRITVVLCNPHCEDIHLSAGTIVGFLILAPFVK